MSILDHVALETQVKFGNTCIDRIINIKFNWIIKRKLLISSVKDK